MAAYLAFADLSEARKMQRAIMTLFDLPLKGRHVGKGRHVDIPENPPDMDARDIIGYTTTDHWGLGLNFEEE